ncbi:hypothetical protein H7B90_32100, partial [Cohnella xylanilytica]|nr:hypothetical protein [Cohnella xylanilytica]
MTSEEKNGRRYPEGIGRNVDRLLSQLDGATREDAAFRDDLKQTLNELTKLKLALDESS